MPRPQPTLVAGGNIYPSRFVKVSTSADFTALQAGANAIVIGVSQPGTNYPPIVDSAVTVAGYAAIGGQTLEIFGDGDVAIVESGASFGSGAFLKSDSNGKAVASLTTGTTVQNIAAISLQAATDSGQFVRVQILAGRPYLPAVS